LYQAKLSKTTAEHIYFWTLGLVFLAIFLFFNFNYRYIDDYRLFIHNSTFTGFLKSYSWGFSRMIGNYFFGLLYLPQNNIFINVAVMLCHIFNGFLIYKLLSKYGSKTLAFFTSLFFISIPITSEAFFWALAGQVVYAICFFLCAVLVYQNYQSQLKLKHAVLIVTLFALSISFYEVTIFFPFLFFLCCLWRKQHLLLAAALSAVSVGYLGALKLVVLIAGGTFTASQKTTLIAFHDISARISNIIHDLFNVFFGKVALTMYRNSLTDALGGKIPIELGIVVGLFVALSLLFIWILNTEKVHHLLPEPFLLFFSFLLGCALVALLIMPVNYFHDLRTFYPFSICLAIFVCEYLRYLSKSPVLLKLHLSLGVMIIGVNMLVLSVENFQYAKLYQDDWTFIQQLEKDTKAGKTTIVYLPGYNRSNLIETQMNLAYYPETNFIYGTHMLAAPSVHFTLTPYMYFGNRQDIADQVGTQFDKYMVHDFSIRQTVSAAEFLGLHSNGTIDLTLMSPDHYMFKAVPANIQKYDGSTLFDRKLYKTFIIHPNCSLVPATLDVTVPPLKKTCQLSYHLFTVNDIEQRTTSDGVDFSLAINGVVMNTIRLQPKDTRQAFTTYRAEVIPPSTGAAQLRFQVTDGGSKNCNDDKIFIAEPLLHCQ